MKKLNPNLKHIGMIRYADHFHPSNEISTARFNELVAKIFGQQPPFDLNLTRAVMKRYKKVAPYFGYEVHLFEKGLGR